MYLRLTNNWHFFFNVQELQGKNKLLNVFDTHLYVYLFKNFLPDSNFFPVKYVQRRYSKYLISGMKMTELIKVNLSIGRQGPGSSLWGQVLTLWFLN